ncbi:E3 ubiquitin-protein ligase TRIM45-like [Saccostrea cucullata]|uniref:E3 ubiquitin-protein ligase TRIM45-like n=1 Tax=Saccostrea cuccullata TaxID=36930 RepID=UPI002ED27B02
MRCDTCLVNLCKACVGEHYTTNLSKPHKIVDFKNRKSNYPYPGCVTHDKERCKMYCKQCDIPLCKKCIASDYHLGHMVSDILQVLDEKMFSIILEQTELNDAIYPTYQDIASDIQNRMSQLEKKYGDLSTAITKHGEDWHRETDKLVRKLTDEYRRIPTSVIPPLPKFKTKRIDERTLCTMFGAPSTSEENGSHLKIEKRSSELDPLLQSNICLMNLILSQP